jgi:hypothetical protein
MFIIDCHTILLYTQVQSFVTFGHRTEGKIKTMVIILILMEILESNTISFVKK